MKGLIHKALKRTGRQIIEYPEASLKRHALILKSQQIDTILDIGANTGQYAALMRELGYGKKIISFEPMSAAFEELSENASKDALWSAMNYALGDQTGKTKINVSGNSYSSSILNMLPSHEESAPASKYVKQEDIEIKRLDDVFDDICDSDAKVMMKVDTQGFEKSVLDGASHSLGKVNVIELEMSLVPLYENGLLYKEMIAFIEGSGFELFSLEHVFSNPTTGQLLQVDGVFVRKNS